LVRAAAKPQDFKWHDLRHSCASFLAQNGANLLEIGSELGHKSVTATLRYAHLVDANPVTGHAGLEAKLKGST
jgi:site-specific recombinase XerD